MYGRNFGCLAAMCLVALFLGAVTAQNVIQAEARISHGTYMDIRQAPYIVQLRRYNAHFCGGTLVHPQFVVTAAHCVDSLDFTGVTVVAGATTRTDEGVQRSVSSWVANELYDDKFKNADVAVLKLDSPMPTINNPYIGTTTICSAPVSPDQLIDVAGWGAMRFNGTGSHNLQGIRVPIMNPRVCQSHTWFVDEDSKTKERYKVPITDYMICAYPNSRDSCEGDSGGPAMYGGELCGIVSFGGECAGSTPGIYTNVYKVREFINVAMKIL